MGHMSYKRVSSGRTSHGSSSFRGFRLSPRRVLVLRLQKRFNFILRLFHRWKFSYGDAIIQVMKRLFCMRGGFNRNNSSRRRIFFVRDEEQIINKVQGDFCRVRSSSYGRSNSFYAEAIEDCLEFIKRTSISSMDQIHQDPITHIQDRKT